jgi:hypothetical protein
MIGRERTAMPVRLCARLRRAEFAFSPGLRDPSGARDRS